MSRSTQKGLYSRRRRSEAGNVFFTLFGAVAIVGVLGAGIMATMRGPLSTMVEVNRREQAKAELRVAASLVLVSSGDTCSDSDGYTEGPDPAAGSGPTNGGVLPGTVGTNRNDPWGNAYGYCAWDHGDVAANYGGCGTNILAGNADTNNIAIAVMSAGPDGIFQTTCEADGAADDYVAPDGGGADDIVVTMTYTQAVSSSGGLWSIKSGDPDVAEIDKGIEVTGGKTATFSGDVNVAGSSSFQDVLAENASLEIADDNLLSVCTADEKNLIRVNDGATDTDTPVLEICDGSGNWVIAGLWEQNGSNIYYMTGNVGIGVNNPDDALDVAGTVQVTGAAVLGNTLTVAGAFTAQSTSALEGDTVITGDSTGDTTDALLVQDSAASVIFVAQNDGNVGIGVADPNDALDVDGVIDATEAYELDNAPVLTDNGVAGNILVGANAGLNATGGNNTVLGSGAGPTNLTTGTDNILIGQGVDVSAPGASNELNIGDTITGNTLTGDVTIANNLTVSGDGTVTGDLTVSGDDLTMGTNTAGHILVADGTNYNPVAVSGDVGIDSSGAVTIQSNAIETGMIQNDAVEESKIDASSFAAGSGSDCLKTDGASIFVEQCSSSGGGDGVGADGLPDVLANDNSANSLKIVDLADPTSAQDAATKSYVDSTVTTAIEGGTTLLIDADSDTQVQVEANADEDKIRFDTAGVERMIIDNVGNVGIGNANPTYKLDVSGYARAYGGALISEIEATSGLLGTLVLNGKNTSSSSRPNATSWQLFNMNEYGTHDGFEIWEYYDADNDGAVCDDGGACDARFTIAPGGNVGIGLGAPTNTLTVRGLSNTSNQGSLVSLVETRPGYTGGFATGIDSYFNSDFMTWIGNRGDATAGSVDTSKFMISHNPADPNNPHLDPDFVITDDSNVVIGDTVASDGSGSGGQALKLDTEGPIGGTYYCDENGLDCFTAADIANGAAGLWKNDGPGGPNEIYYNSGPVGIGTNDPDDNSSLHIEEDRTLAASNSGLYIDIDNNPVGMLTEDVYTNGVNSVVRGVTTNDNGGGHYGYFLGGAFTAQHDDLNTGTDGERAYGLLARAIQTGSGTLSTALGSVGNATAGAGTISTGTGVYGQATGDGGDFTAARGVAGAVFTSKDGSTITNAVGVVGNISELNGNGTIITGKALQADCNDADTCFGLYVDAGDAEVLAGQDWGLYVTGEDQNYFSGNVGIGDDSPDQGGDVPLKLDVEGAIGAMHYCDEDGNNCFTAAVVGTAGVLEDADQDTKIQVEESSDEDIIRFDTAGTERMVIDETGKIGIGTGSPAAALDVIASSGAAETSAIGFYSATNGAGLPAYSIGMGPTSSEGYMAYRSGTDNSSLYGHKFMVNAIERMRITGEGNVGIGTDSPAGHLHISGDGVVGGTLVVDRYGGGAHIPMRSANGTKATPTVLAVDDVIAKISGQGWNGSSFSTSGTISMHAEEPFSATNAGAYMAFSTRAAGAGQSLIEKMRITSAGNVGIGTNGPAKTLDVVGTARVTNSYSGFPDMSMNSGGSDYAFTEIYSANTDDGDTPYLSFHRGSNIAWQQGLLGGDFVIAQGGGAGTSDLFAQKDIVIKSTTGNVGIGTTTPAEKLDVSGKVKVSNSVIITGVSGAAAPVTEVVDAVSDGDKGDITVAGSGATWTIDDDTITEAMLKAVDTASDEECLTYETTTGDFEWQPCDSGSAGVLADTDGDTQIQVEESADEDHIRFDTAGTERMVIDETGKVGIGVTDPAQTLHVSGDIRTNAGDLEIINPGVGGWARGVMMLPTSGGTPTSDALGGVGFHGTDATQTSIFLAHGPAPWASTSGMHILSNGNVGIGTSSPDAKLHIDDDTTPYFYITTSGALATPAMWLAADYDTTPKYAGVGIPAGSSNLSFQVGSSSFASPKMVITPSGNVGIGTDSPVTTLSVLGEAPTAGDFNAYSGKTDDSTTPLGYLPDITSYRPDVAGANQVTYRGGVGLGLSGVGIYSLNPNPAGSSYYGDIRFYTTVWDGAHYDVYDRMIIDLYGNVVIGGTSASDGSGGGGQALKLDVEGAAGATHYCDEDGLNCFTAASVSGSGVTELDDLSDATKDLTDNNLFLGHEGGSAGDNNDNNLAVGIGALASLDNSAVQTYHGDSNTALGINALNANTSGYWNVASGSTALYSNTTGHSNTASGSATLYSNTTGNANTASGNAALYFNTTGNYNTVSGYAALYHNTTGASNVASGYDAGRFIADGSTANATSSSSIYLGALTKALADGGDNEIVIGHNAIGAGSNSVVLGNDSITKTVLKGNVGIGTDAPEEKLVVHSGSAMIAGAGVVDPVIKFKDGSNVGWTVGMDDSGHAAGNNTLVFAANDGIGTNEHVVISGSGNIGIGVASPGEKLDVAGSVQVSDGVVFANISGASAPTSATISDDTITEAMLKAVDTASDEECLTYETTTGDFEWQSCGGSADLVVDADADTQIQVEESADEDKIRFDTAGTERMIIDNVGNVGVGVLLPGEKLDVAGSIKVSDGVLVAGATGMNAPTGGTIDDDTITEAMLKAVDTASDEECLTYETTTGDFEWQTCGGDSDTVVDVDGDTQIQVEESADEDVIRFDTAGTQRMVIDGSGKVGVANPNPAQALDVTGKIKVSESVIITGAAGAEPVSATVEASALIDADSDTQIQVEEGSDEDMIRFDTAGAERMIIDENGNVGIGVTDPSVKLDVDGDIQYTGTLTDVSDRRLKTDITKLGAAEILARLAQIDAYSFRMKDDEEGTLELGVIAQEVEKVFPELVRIADDEMQTRSVNYIGFIAPLIEATTMLHDENTTLRGDLAALEQDREDMRASLDDLADQVALLNKAAGGQVNKAAFPALPVHGAMWALMLLAMAAAGVGFGAGALAAVRRRN